MLVENTMPRAADEPISAASRWVRIRFGLLQTVRDARDEPYASRGDHYPPRATIGSLEPVLRDNSCLAGEGEHSLAGDQPRIFL